MTLVYGKSNAPEVGRGHLVNIELGEGKEPPYRDAYQAYQ